MAKDASGDRRLGGRIEQAMTGAGLTRAELAFAVHTTDANLGFYINGVRMPSVRRLRAIAAACRISLADLLGDDDPRPHAPAVVLPGWFDLPKPYRAVIADLVGAYAARLASGAAARAAEDSPTYEHEAREQPDEAAPDHREERRRRVMGGD